MASTNITHSRVSEFQLICFPGIQSWQHWLSILLVLLFLLTLAANSTLLTTIYSAPNLHHPMYFFLCLLALVDLLITFSVSPKAMAILLFDLKTTSLTACYSQMFVIYLCQGMQSSIFMLLSCDRYVAICNPLRYASIMTNKLTIQASALALTSSTVFALPFPLLVSRLNYCSDNVVVHCFCENLPVARLACDSHAASSFYSLAVVSIFLGFNTTLMAFSYIMIIREVLRLGSSTAALKALSTCSSHLTLIGFFYCVVLGASISNRAEKAIPPFGRVLLTVLQYVTPPFLHPLVYGIRTMEIRRAFQKMLGKNRQFFTVKVNLKIVQLHWKQ